jgi:hypothetical protein
MSVRLPVVLSGSTFAIVSIFSIIACSSYGPGEVSIDGPPGGFGTGGTDTPMFGGPGETAQPGPDGGTSKDTKDVGFDTHLIPDTGGGVDTGLGGRK